MQAEDPVLLPVGVPDHPFWRNLEAHLNQLVVMHLAERVRLEEKVLRLEEKLSRVTSPPDRHS